VFCFFALTLALRSIIPAPNEVTSGNAQIIISRCSIQLDQTSQPLLEIYEKFFDSNFACLIHDASPFIIQSEITDSSDSCTDESYELTVTQTKAKISSQCYAGSVRGYATLFNLFEFNENYSMITIDSLPIHIKDSPRFEYRGVMIDTSRHFLKKSTIKNVIDGMFLVKLNVLHWHISDDDSFSMYSPSYPDLAKDASFSSSMIYKKEDINEIVAYANKRSIKIVPEFDTPSHTRALGLHEPLRDILTCFNEPKLVDIEGYGPTVIGPPEAAMDPTMNKTYEVVKNLFKDLDEYFKGDMVHLGGDEVQESCWDERPSIKEYMKQHNIPDYKALMSHYIERERKVVQEVSPSKKLVQWICENESKIKYGEDEVLQYWGHSDNITKIAARFPKNKFILSPHNYAYLDCGYESITGKNCWCGEFNTWTHMYHFEPTNFGIAKDKILGGEVCAWAEVINDDNIENKLWPRSAAYAAAFWEPPRPAIPDLPRLADSLDNFSKHLNALGISTSPITGEYCERDPEECFSQYKG
jgi:hexosaminidase